MLFVEMEQLWLGFYFCHGNTYCFMILHEKKQITQNIWLQKAKIEERLPTSATFITRLNKCCFEFITEFKILGHEGRREERSGVCVCLCVCVHWFSLIRKATGVWTFMTSAALVALNCLWREIHLSSPVCVSQISSDLLHTCTRFPSVAFLEVNFTRLNKGLTLRIYINSYLWVWLSPSSIHSQTNSHTLGKTHTP